MGNQPQSEKRFPRRSPGRVGCLFCYAEAERVRPRVYRCRDCGARWRVTRDPTPDIPREPTPPPEPLDPRIEKSWQLIEDKRSAYSRGDEAEAERLNGEWLALWTAPEGVA